MAHSKKETFDPRQAALARYAKALAHPARVAILETLAKRATCICGEIVEVLPLAQSTVSQHLKELKDAGLVTGEVDGLKSCYCLNEESIAQLERLFERLLRDLKNGINSKRCC